MTSLPHRQITTINNQQSPALNSTLHHHGQSSNLNDCQTREPLADSGARRIEIVAISLELILMNVIRHKIYTGGRISIDFNFPQYYFGDCKMLKLGLVSYNLAKNWDLNTVLERLE